MPFSMHFHTFHVFSKCLERWQNEVSANYFILAKIYAHGYHKEGYTLISRMSHVYVYTKMQNVT